MCEYRERPGIDIYTILSRCYVNAILCLIGKEIRFYSVRSCDDDAYQIRIVFLYMFNSPTTTNAACSQHLKRISYTVVHPSLCRVSAYSMSLYGDLIVWAEQYMISVGCVTVVYIVYYLVYKREEMSG